MADKRFRRFQLKFPFWPDVYAIRINSLETITHLTKKNNPFAIDALYNEVCQFFSPITCSCGYAAQNIQHAMGSREKFPIPGG